MNCYCCQSNNLEELKYYNVSNYAEFGWQKYFDNRTLHLCKDCGFAFNLPFISTNDLNDFYTKYFIKKRKKYFTENLFNFLYRPDISIIYRMFYFLSHVDIKNEKPIFLDFGGGRGNTAENFKSFFKNSEVFCDDSSTYDKILKRKGIGIKKLNEFQDCSIDLIHSSHVVEHFNANEIKPILNLLHKKLSNEGYIFIETPNDNISKYKERKIYSQGPHLVHYSLNTLIKFFKDSNFRIIDARVVGHNRNMVDQDIPFNKSAEYLSKITFKNIYSKFRNFLGNNKNIILQKTWRHFLDPKLFIHNKSGSIIQLIAKKIEE